MTRAKVNRTLDRLHILLHEALLFQEIDGRRTNMAVGPDTTAT